MKKLFWRRIHEGEMLPPFYGITFIQYHNPKGWRVASVVPFNLIIGIFLSIYIFVRWGYKGVSINPREAYRQGRIDEELKYTKKERSNEPASK